MTKILSCLFPVEQQPKYPGPKAEKNANDYFPYYMRKYEEDKSELHAGAEGQEKTSVSKLSLSQNDSVNKVNSKFLTGRGGGSKSYFIS